MSEHGSGSDTTDRWLRLSALFDEALEQPPEHRSQWVEGLPSTDESVRHELLLMLAAHEQPIGVLDRRVSPPRIEPTALIERLRPALKERYVIVRPLGRGGMASVFLAREQKHDRDVVIKVLDPGVALTFGAHRFHDEVRIAARLSHPHILALLDSGEADGLLYYVMPHVEGETLRDMLRRKGRLDINEGLPLLRDVADALAYAHGRGVIHRDLKPDNILCTGGHAYLLDFGVAKSVATLGGGMAAVTDAGHAVGTPGYMSPEQASGQTVDARSDVYAWGLVATETIGGSNERGSLAAYSVPSPLSRLVDRCLALDKHDRPGSARELVQSLDSLLESRGIRSHRTTRAPSRTLLGVGALSVAMAAGVFAWTSRPPAAAAPAERLPMPIAVAPLVNETGDTTLTVWGRLAADWLTQGLEESGSVSVVPWASIRAVHEREASGDVRDLVGLLSRETGAATVVSGSYYAVGDSIRVQLAVTDASAKRSIGTLPPMTLPRDSMSALMGMLRERVQGFVALQLDERLPVPDAVTRIPPTYDAYRAFDRGLALYTNQQYRAAATELREAYARDTTFLAPLIFAAMGHWNTGELEWTDTLVRTLDARRARLSPFADAMTTHLSALLRSDANAALQAVREAAKAAPGMRAEYGAAHLALGMNRPREALDALAGVDPDRGMMRGWSSYWTQLAHAHHLLGEHDAELAAANEMRRRYPERRAAEVFAVRALAATERHDATNALLDSLSRLPADTYWSYGGALIVAGDERLERRDTLRAREYFERAIAWFQERLSVDPDDLAVLYWLGSAFYHLGDDSAAAAMFDKLRRLYPDRLQHHGLYAVALARLGRAEEALQVLGPPPRYARGEHTAYRARIAAVSGDTALASALLEQVLSEGYNSWPWYTSTTIRDFGPLRDAPVIARSLPVTAR